MTAIEQAVSDEALDAAMAKVPGRHLGFAGGWEPAISRKDAAAILEAAAPFLAADALKNAAAETERLRTAVSALSGAAARNAAKAGAERQRLETALAECKFTRKRRTGGVEMVRWSDVERVLGGGDA
jgi:hypothetical protein